MIDGRQPIAAFVRPVIAEKCSIAVFIVGDLQARCRNSFVENRKLLALIRF